MIELTQLMGVFAAIVGLTGYLRHSEAAFKIQIGCSSWLWGIHFALLGSHSATLTQFAIGTRSWCSIGRHGPRYRHGLFHVSSVIFLAFAIFGWDGWISLLPLGAAINSTAALVYGDNKSMRIRLLGSSALWIATGLYWHSWPIVLTEAIAVSLNVRTIWRLQRV